MAITSEVGIYNLALNAVGGRSNLSSPTEDSREAEVCRLWYEPVLEQVLAAAHWPEVTKIVNLAQLAEEDDEKGWLETQPRPGYRYVYQLPADYLHARYLNDFEKFLITYYGDNKRALHTNSYQAALAYTAKITNVALFEPQLRMAIVYGLAAHICMPLSGKPQRAKMLEDRANNILWSAREAAANMSNEQYEHVPDWIAARGYNFAQTTGYVHPYGSLLSVASIQASN